MTALKKRITNPMTVIAIFATLSETSAAVSLPFLDEKEREIYIWFLITFPFYLLFLFFATLNFNYRSLYAPSDFEKGKHFIKVMDIAKRSGNAAPTKKWRSDQRPGCAQDPPAAPLSVQHYVRLPERLKDLYIIDTRWTSQKIELDCLIGKIHKEQGKSAHAIVFLTCAQTETMLKESTLKHSKHARKHSSAMCCIAYNLNSQGMTVIDQSLPTDTRQSVAIEDQPERNCQEGDNRN